ncbi:hypothetical protein [Nonlabens antarcticus]|uniref:hypothetical protein n=1 Tax=Nonlabens antarcticus TaxID=392714 RepID=UPI001891E8BD|nr:hypothetical protein [Nonlabens antarcticus]
MTNKYGISLSVLLLTLSFTVYGQVGIGTDAPNGALDISSTSSGFVYPVVELQNTNSQTISNPNAPNLIAGTTVYNTTTSNSGLNSVYPGIYIWDGSAWIAQFNKNDYKLFEQVVRLNPASNYGNEIINFNASSFKPKYSGKYKVKVTVHYGGGETNTPNQTTQFVNFVAASGKFIYNFNGLPSTFNLKSYSGHNSDSDLNGGTTKTYVDQYRQTNITREEILTANTDYNFSLTFNQDDLPGIINNGDYLEPDINPAGLGYIILERSLKCTVEINYVGN